MANIRSLHELGRGRGGNESDDDDVNEYYTGGEKSGQLVRGAPKQEDLDEEDRVNALFERARRSGAVQGTSEDIQQQQQAFRGRGHRIGDSSQVPGARPTGPLVHVITFYRNNVFTVNDGPARRVDDPANFSFISSISKGECPEELEPDSPTPLNVNLVRKEEDYVEPEKPKYQAFRGAGRTLGASAVAEPAAASAAASAAPSGSGEWRGVDESEPVTSLQLRLADGSRNVARFNQSHRVADIRQFIRASRPDLQFPYVLISGVPPQPIANEELTLKDAGLLNAVIIQRK